MSTMWLGPTPAHSRVMWQFGSVASARGNMPFFHLAFEMKYLAEFPTVCSSTGFQLQGKSRGLGQKEKHCAPWN